jgi:predicted Fe-Mo cluster-binding NifX family protein
VERRSPIYIDAARSSVLAHPQLEGTATTGSGTRLAVALNSSQAGAEVARVFGRAPVFALVDPDGAVRFADNPGLGVQRGAAAQAVALLQSEGVGRIVAGRFGPDALENLGTARIEPRLAVGMKLRQVIELLNVAKK